MYLARLETDDGPLVQALVSAPDLGAVEASGRGADFHRHWARLAGGAFALGLAAASLRASLSAEGGVRFDLVLTAPAAREDALRRVVARLMLLEGLVPGGVAAALDREAFDAALAPPEGLVLVRDDRPRPGPGGAALVETALVFEALERAFARFTALGWPLAYQVDLARAAPPRAALAALGASVARLRGSPATADLAETQHRALMRAAAAGLHVGELVVVPPGQADAFGAACPAPLRPASADEAESLAAGLHALLLFGALPDGDSPLPGARDEAAWTAVCDWRPRPKAVRAAPAPPAAAGGGELTLSPVVRGGAHLVAGEDRPFAFISYAHADAEVVIPILGALRAQGLNLWFDVGIPGSSEWSDVLERRLYSASGLLAFLSPSAVNSKYCRRELKFADALDKPILPVVLEPVSLKDGLGLILGPVQAIADRGPGPILDVARRWGVVEGLA